MYLSKCAKLVLKDMPEVWSPEGLMKRSFNKAERNEKNCTSNTNPDTINTLHLERHSTTAKEMNGVT